MSIYEDEEVECSPHDDDDDDDVDEEEDNRRDSTSVLAVSPPRLVGCGVGFCGADSIEFE